MPWGGGSEAEIEQRRNAGVKVAKHGGAGAVRAIQRGEPLHGLAAEAEREIYAELAENGAYSIIERNAIRLQAATDLYWNAIQKAAQDNDLKALDHYVSRYGWLAGASLRAWAMVRQEQRQRDPLSAAKVLDAVKKGSNDDK